MTHLEEAKFLKSKIDKRTKKILDKILKRELEITNLNDDQVETIISTFSKNDFKDIISQNYKNGGAILTKRANCYLFVNLYIIFNIHIKDEKNEDTDNLRELFNSNIDSIVDTKNDLELLDDELNSYIKSFEKK